jgi:hypothetical protein
MVWTVTNGNVFTDAYVINGKTVTFTLTIGQTTLSGTASNEVRVALPASMKVMREVNTVARLGDVVAGTAILGYAKVGPAASYIRITNFDVTNLPLTTGFGVMAQITFEIE